MQRVMFYQRIDKKKCHMLLSKKNIQAHRKPAVEIRNTLKAIVDFSICMTYI